MDELNDDDDVLDGSVHELRETHMYKSGLYGGKSNIFFILSINVRTTTFDAILFC